MIKTTCPHCDTPLKGPDQFAGKRPRCPECRAPVPAPGAAAATALAEPPPSGEEALLDSLMAEVEHAPAAPGARLAETAPLQSKAKPPAEGPVLRPKPKRSQWALIVSIAAVLLVTLGGAWWAFHTIKSRRALSEARLLANRISRDEPTLLAYIGEAEAHAEKGDYGLAKESYQAALGTGERLMADIEKALLGVDTDSARRPLEEARNRIAPRVEQVRTALQSPEIQKGSEGLVLFEGNWVTAEERDELFRQRMHDQGRKFYEEFEQWMTEEEYHVAKGHVKYKDKWMTPAQYEQVKAEEERREREAAAAAETEAERRAAELARQQEERRRREEAARRAREAQYPPDAERWALDDFEGEQHRWAAQTWGNPATLAVVSHRGSKQLQVSVEAGIEDKAAISRPLRIDLTGREAIEMDIENLTDSAVQVAIALQTNEFFESRMVRVRPGINSGVKFRIDSGDFKAESTGWAHRTKVANLNNVRVVFLLIYTRRAGVFYIDNVAAVKGE